MQGSAAHLVSGHDHSPPLAAVLIDDGRTHVVCHAERLSAFALWTEERDHHARRLWRHSCTGRVIALACLGDHRVAVLLEVDGGARVDIVNHEAVRSIASAKGWPTALAAFGNQLAFAVTDADGAATIRIINASSGRLAKVLVAPFAVDDIGADTRLNELLIFGRGVNRTCRIPIDDPCFVGTAARLRMALATGTMSRLAVPSMAFAMQRKCSCCGGCGCACCGGGSGQNGSASSGGGQPGGEPGGGAGGPTSEKNCPWCLPGGPGVFNGCYLFIIIDGRRVVRIDLCHPGIPPCAIMVDRPVERLVKAGSFLVAQGDGGHYMAQIDPATMTIVEARAFPRGGAIVTAHPALPVLMLYDRRLKAWHSLDLSSAPVARGLRRATQHQADPGAIFGGPCSRGPDRRHA
jgi:hypothetical protein